MDVFVYGTLTDPASVASVVDEFAFGPDAELRGLHRVEGRYPTLAPGGRTAGRILRVDDVAAVDTYEGVEGGLYVRVAVALVGTDETVAVYVGDPSRLDADATWPGARAFAERVRSHLAERDVVVRSL